MFFGLCNSPATFQALMDDLFSDMIEEGWLVIYMDDMLLFSKDRKTHKERMRRVLQWLRENDLYLKPEKCLFDVEEVEFLGLIVKPDTLAMDPVKLKGIEDWPGHLRQRHQRPSSPGPCSSSSLPGPAPLEPSSAHRPDGSP